MMDSFSKFNSEFKKQTSLQNGKLMQIGEELMDMKLDLLGSSTSITDLIIHTNFSLRHEMTIMSLTHNEAKDELKAHIFNVTMGSLNSMSSTLSLFHNVTEDHLSLVEKNLNYLIKNNTFLLQNYLNDIYKKINNQLNSSHSDLSYQFQNNTSSLQNQMNDNFNSITIQINSSSIELKNHISISLNNTLSILLETNNHLLSQIEKIWFWMQLISIVMLSIVFLTFILCIISCIYMCILNKRNKKEHDIL